LKTASVKICINNGQVHILYPEYRIHVTDKEKVWSLVWERCKARW